MRKKESRRAGQVGLRQDEKENGWGKKDNGAASSFEIGSWWRLRR